MRYFYIFNADGSFKYGVQNNSDITVDDYKALNPGCDVIDSEEIEDIYNYRLVDGVITKLSDEKIKEIEVYGHELTEEEKQEIKDKEELKKLIPSASEIHKADMQLLILDTLEVLKNE